MDTTSSEQLLKASIEKLKAEIAENQRKIEAIKQVNNATMATIQLYEIIAIPYQIKTNNL